MRAINLLMFTLIYEEQDAARVSCCYKWLFHPQHAATSLPKPISLVTSQDYKTASQNPIQGRFAPFKASQQCHYELIIHVPETYYSQPVEALFSL